MLSLPQYASIDRGEDSSNEVIIKDGTLTGRNGYGYDFSYVIAGEVGWKQHPWRRYD